MQQCLFLSLDQESANFFSKRPESKDLGFVALWFLVTAIQLCRNSGKG